MKLSGLKYLVEAGGYGGSGSGNTGGPSPVTPRPSSFDLKNTTGVLDLAQKLVTGTGKAGLEAAKYAGAALATPPSQLAAGLSGRGSGLGWGEEAAKQRFKWFRQGLPGALAGLGAGLAGKAAGALGRKITGSSIATSVAGSAFGQKVGQIGNWLSPAAGALATTVAPFLKNYANAGKDELAKIAAAATGDFRDASVLGTVETEIKKQPVQKVKIVP